MLIIIWCQVKPSATDIFLFIFFFGLFDLLKVMVCVVLYRLSIFWSEPERWPEESRCFGVIQYVTVYLISCR